MGGAESLVTLGAICVCAGGSVLLCRGCRERSHGRAGRGPRAVQCSPTRRLLPKKALELQALGESREPEKGGGWGGTGLRGGHGDKQGLCGDTGLGCG